MKKLFLILLTIATFAMGADVKPFVFDGVDSASQQTEFDYMLKYKMFGANGITFNGQNIKVPDKSGWFGTADGNFVLKETEHIIGGPILIGGNISFFNGDDGFTTGPVRVAGDVIIEQTGFKDRTNVSAGFNCVKGAVNEMFANIVANDSQYFGENYINCPSSVPEIKTTLRTPTVNDDTITYKEAIFQNGGIYTLDIANYCDLTDTTKKLCDIYIDKITLNNDARLYVKMPVGGKLTRIFLKEGLILDATHPQIRVMYGDNVIRNDKYSGNLLIYSTKDFVFEALAQNDSMQGTFITTGKIHIKQQMTLAGQLLANNLFIDANFDGSGFIYVKFDPDTLRIDPELNESAALRENDSTVVIPIKLSDTATIDVYFSYCFELNDKVDSSDFNLVTDFPVCGIDTKTVKIPVGSKVPTDSIKINVKKDDIEETSDSLIIKIKIESGAVLPNGETSGELKIKIIDAEAAKNTSIVLDKTDTIKTYQEELRIPPGTGLVGNIKYTDDGLEPLVWTVEDTSGLFTVENGVIKTTHVFDYETEDTVYVIKVKVVDGEFADSANYTIKITNIQEPITVTAKIDSVKENSDPGTIVGAIIGKDADSTDVTYSLNDITNFFIDPVLGTITTKTVFDYETKKTYPITVTVTSTDGSKKDTNLVIYVNDVNEPVHTKDDTITVKEKYTGPIGKIEGKDDDRKPVIYSVSDTVRYSIDSVGNLTLKEPFDYNTQKSDTVKVIVTDGTFYDTATVTINVQNVNDPPVLHPNDTLKVPENCKNCIVGIITATDPDKDPIKYTVKEPGFTIDSAGVLKLTEPLDYEKTPVVTVTVIATDPSGAGDTATYKIKVTDINEPVHTKDTTCSVKENYTGNVCKIPGTDDDGTKPTFIVTDTTNYSIDSTGQLVIKNPIDYEKKTKDTVKIIVTDGEFSDTATVIINVIDVDETPEITKIDDKQPVDTLKTNDPDHKIDYRICEGDSCETGTLDVPVHKDTTVKVCNTKKTKCDSVVILFNDAPPVVTLTNAKSTNAYIDYITIEEQKDDKIYVNKKENPITVTVKDTVHKTEKHFDIKVKLDTIPSKDIKLKEYNYLIDETKATINPIGGNKGELVEVINDNGTEVTIKQIIDLKTGKPIDTVQTVSYTKKVNGKEVVVTYKTDNLTGQKIGDYEVSYMADSCTKVTYTMNDKKQIVKNDEGNIGYTITYDYVDDYGNKASASVEIVYDDIPPKVEILEPYEHDTFKTNAIPVKWTVNGEVQDTLTLQRLEKGVNYVIRRYVDKAGNEAADTVWVIMKEAKDIDITIIHPVTEINKDKVDEFYSNGEKYDPKKPYKVTMVNPKDDSLPETIGIGFKIDIALPSVSATGGLATLDDIVKNGQIPVDDKGNIVGASTKGIPVEKYVEEHCTAEFQEDYRKNGLNIPLYDVKYNLHLWVWTTTANYVNDFNVEYTLNDQETTSEAGTVQMVVDWLTDKEGAVRAKGGKALGTGSYITKLYSKSVAKHRCDYKEQVKGDKTVKKEENMKTFGYKRPTKK